jgi:mannose-6-phosphate isomerase-like protein (cupin superfamily)
MKITDWKENDQPLVTESGEIIYELIGSVQNDGTKPNHSLARIIIPPGKSSTSHYHKVSEETYYFLEGEGQMRVNEKDFTLIPGQTCYLSAGDIHQIENRGDMDLEFLAVCTPAWVPEDSFDV